MCYGVVGQAENDFRTPDNAGAWVGDREAWWRGSLRLKEWMPYSLASKRLEVIVCLEALLGRRKMIFALRIMQGRGLGAGRLGGVVRFV